MTLEVPEEVVESKEQMKSGETLYHLKSPSCRMVVKRWIDLGKDVHLSSLVGMDQEDSIEVLYYFMDRLDKEKLLLSIRLKREMPKTESISDLIGSRIYEAEVTEMFGVKFEGNEMTRAFLPENWIGGYPLRKDWKKEDYENE